MYVAGKNPRRTPLSGKMAIYGWTITIKSDPEEQRKREEMLVF